MAAIGRGAGDPDASDLAPAEALRRAFGTTVAEDVAAQVAAAQRMVDQHLGWMWARQMQDLIDIIRRK